MTVREQRLFYNAQVGDRRARNELLEMHVSVIDCALRKYNLDEYQRQDAVQNGVFSLVKAIEKFDATRGDFKSFASIIIRRDFLNSMRPTQHDYEIWSLDWIEEDDENDTRIDQLADLSIEREFESVIHRDQVDRYLAVLTDRERDIIVRSFGIDGISQTERQIAEDLNISRSTVNSTITTALEKMRR